MAIMHRRPVRPTSIRQFTECRLNDVAVALPDAPVYACYGSCGSNWPAWHECNLIVNRMG